MTIKNVKNLAHELLLKPFGGAGTLVVGSASLLSWMAIGEHWTTITKVLVSTAIALGFLFSRAIYIAYSMHTEVGQLHMKVDQLKSGAPLHVRNVSQGTHYYAGQVTIILERHDTVSIGDILTLFIREGDIETPVCLLSIEAITSAGFPQSVVFRSLTHRPLFGYLRNQDRLKQLQAKRGVSRHHLEGGC